MIAQIDITGSRYSYDAYLQLSEDLLAEGKTTGTNHSPDMIEYTRINVQRLHRIHKATQLQPELVAALKGIKGKYRWTVIAEAWCGDVAQNLPVIALAAAEAPQVELEIVLRDENPVFMEQHLTNGGKAIPIMVVTDANTGAFITRWGPRPAGAQAMVRAYKALAADVKPPYSEFVKELQLWYRDDHTRTLQSELLEIVRKLA